MWSFLKDHWKTIAVAALATAVFVVVSVATAGIAPALLGVAAGGTAATLLGVAAGGAASGAAGYALGQYLNKQPITARGIATAAAVSTVLSVATMGLGARLTPLVSRAVAPAVESLPVSAAVAQGATRVVTNAAVGTGLGAASQVAQNAVMGRPLNENVGQASVIGGVTGAALDPVQRAISSVAAPRGPPPTEPTVRTAPAEPPASSGSQAQPERTGIVQALEKLQGGKDGGSRSGALGGEDATPQALDGRVTAAKKIGGSANDVQKVTLDDGSSHIVKGESLAAKVQSRMFGIRSQNAQEVAAYKVDQAMGLDMVPETKLATYQGRDVVQQEFVPGKPPKELAGDPVLDTPTYKKGVLDMKAFDYLIKNIDRHKGNYLVDPQTGKVILIDNGFSGANAQPFYRSGGMPRAVTPEFVGKLQAMDPAALRTQLEPYMTPKQIDALLARRQNLLDGVQSGSIQVKPNG